MKLKRWAWQHLPYWKCGLSYLFDISLEKTSSPYNDFLEVLVSKGRIRLNGLHVTYSYEDLYDNFSRTFKYLNLSQQSLSKVLVLGFGLGSIPYMLEHSFGQNAHYVGVEIDADVLKLADKYMCDELRAAVSLHCADAYTFVQTKHDTYNLIATDLFIDRFIPDQFRRTDFLQNLKVQLAPNGYLIYNTLTLTPQSVDEAHAFFEKTFLPIFKNAYTLDLTSNLMLIYRKEQ